MAYVYVDVDRLEQDGRESHVGGGQGRRGAAFRPLQQGRLRVEGFFLEDVQGRAFDMAVFHEFQKGLFVDDAPPGAIDHANAFFRFGEGLAVEQPAGLVGQGHVHGDDI